MSGFNPALSFSCSVPQDEPGLWGMVFRPSWNALKGVPYSNLESVAW